MHTAKASNSGNRIAFLLLGISLLGLAGVPQARAQGVPHYKVDASWPKELPNNWILWNSTGLVIDKNDHIWVLNRGAETPDQSVLHSGAGHRRIRRSR
jgi:hypothetical protein